LKLYELHREDLNKLKTGIWKPQLYLTPEENMIVKKEGTVLLLGRSGTGKTICICNRICHDLHKAEGDPYFKQLFVARSIGLCRYVEGVVGNELSGDGSEGQKRTTYSTWIKLLKTCEDRVVQDRRDWESSKLMDYPRFKREVIGDLRSKWILRVLEAN
jgi:GTPase SAR1 family protein